MNLPGPLILASTSPRRQQLLPLLGIPFEVIDPAVEELDEGEPAEVVVANAVLKAEAGAAAADVAEAVVLACDTDVILDGRVLGKPDDRAVAIERLEALSGRTHEVLSGVAVAFGGSVKTALERTRVGFSALSQAEIEAYVETGEWEGRAGGYAVQGFGSSLIGGIEGDLSSVIGLPLRATRILLSNLQSD